VGAHACPGENLAVTIAQAGVSALLASRLDLSALPARMTYRPSANARIPLFDMIR
jgi:cytochrome P450